MQDDVRAAVEEQSVPMLRAALQRRHTCPRDHALHEAVRQGSSAAVRLLLQHQAEPNASCLCLERGCEFPLQLAVSSNFIRASERSQIVQLLLAAGAHTEPRRSDAEGNAPLHDAVRRGEADITFLLLGALANPNAKNGFGETALELALRGNDFMGASSSRAMVEALLHAGACPFITDQAVSVTDPEIQELLARWSSWWRCRVLAWIRSRGSGHPLCHMMPELLVQVAQFL